MTFLLSSEQEDLRDGMRQLCQGRFPMSRVRDGFDAEVWRELAAAGVFTLDDLGVGVAGAAVVFEELGRALVPGPLVWGYLNGRDEQVVTGMEEESTAVAHLEAADAVLVLDAEGVRSIDAAAVDAAAVERPLDPLTPLHRLTGPLPAGDSRDGDAGPWWDRGAVLVAAQLVGIAGATTDMAVGYAKERTQFDRPIGSFQAVKHLLADMLVRAELARAAVHAAAVHLDDADADAGRAIASAKVLAGEAALANAKTCVQVHGGMGFTWEVDVHLYLKRAWVLDKTFGSVQHHAEAVAASLPA